MRAIIKNDSLHGATTKTLHPGSQMSVDIAELTNKTNPARIINANHRSKTGWISGDPQSGPVAFESTLERDCAFRLISSNNVELVRSQPITIYYDRKDDSKGKYTPDFEVSYFDQACCSKTAYIECKYEDDWLENKEQYLERFAAMNNLAEDNGQTFYLVTEKHIRTPAMENIRNLYAFRNNGASLNSQSVDVLLKIKPHLPISNKDALSLFSKDRVKRAETQPYILQLLASGDLGYNVERPLDMLTVLTDPRDEVSNTLFFQNGMTFK